MSTFAYQVRDDLGRIQKGTMEAISQELLVERLRSLGYWVTEIRPIQSSLFSIRSRRIKSDQFVMYLVQLASMLGAGVSLPQSLQILIQQTENPQLVHATQDVLREIQGGKTLSAALKSYPKIFSNLFVHMIEAGEASGNLEEVISRLSGFVERDADIRSRIKSAMIYPVILIVLGITVVFYLIAFVVPNFVGIFQSAGVPLPLPTQVLYSFGLFIKALWPVLLGGSVSGTVFFVWFRKTATGQVWLDRLMLRLPVFGGLLRKVIIARFARTLATLLSSGLPLLQSLEITERTLNHTVFEAALQKVTLGAARGEPISKPLRESGVFPPMTVQMISVGEETGALDTMLLKVGEFYEKVCDQTIKNLSALIEPFFLIVIGGLVGLIFASLMMPVFSLVKTLRHR